MDTLFSLKHLKQDLEFEIRDVSSLIGRSANCDIQIDRETLSREHARLTQKAGTLFVQDLHSTNGSYVNENSASEAIEVKPGDVLRFGQESFTVQQKDSEATVMFNRDQLSNSDSAMLVEDDEEADGTVMIQSISLPVGWSETEDELSSEADISEADAKLLTALKAHAKSKLKHASGLLITTAMSNKAPTVKLLSTDQSSASWRVGRGAENDLQLDDARVSDQHAKLSLDDGRWQLLDSGSRNGTIVGGQSLKIVTIEDRAKVEIGPYTLLFEIIVR